MSAPTAGQLLTRWIRAVNEVRATTPGTLAHELAVREAALTRARYLRELRRSLEDEEALPGRERTAPLAG